jgi:hypothetical protein
MKPRAASWVLNVVVVGALVGLTLAALGGQRTAATSAARPAPITVQMPELSDADLVRAPRAPQGPAQEVPGVARLWSESFEATSFPPLNSKWGTIDRCAIFPGQSDVVKWGRTECDASHGKASLWAAGGGTIGSGLKCGGTYPPEIVDPRRGGGCTRMDTLVRYVYLDCSSVKYGMRVTFDYKSKMPQGALRLAVGPRNDDGSVTFSDQHVDFQADSGGQWVRGTIREFTNSVAFMPKIVLGFFYFDDAKTSGMQGAFIDNIHVDALYEANTGIIGSPTVPVPTATITPEPTETPIGPTNTPRPTKTPRPTGTPIPHRIRLPLGVRGYNLASTPRPTVSPRPTVPTPTETLVPTETPEPTDTPRPSRTPRPTQTPTRTPYPTQTDVPYGKVVIAQIHRDIPGMPPNLETVILTNIGTAPQLMDGWRVYNDSHSKNCRLPAGVTINPGASYEIRSDTDAATDETGWACTTDVLWNAHKDFGQLWDNVNILTSCLAYNENGYFDCMPTD